MGKGLHLVYPSGLEITIPDYMVDMFKSEKGEDIRKKMFEFDEHILKEMYCVCEGTELCSFHADLNRKKSR